jgi:uncharacterized membrane protein
MMEQALIAFTLITGVIGLVTFVATSVWAVAQVKETTASLGIQIKNLGKSIDKLGLDVDDMEKRLRDLESGR